MNKPNESKNIREKIRKLEAAENQTFRTVLENSLYGSAIADVNGNILYLNKYFAEIHGYAKDELTGKNLSVFHSEEQLPRVMQLNRKLTEEGGFHNEEVWHVHKDGTKFPMLMTGLGIKDQDGNIEYLATSAIDISDRKKAVTTLIENEQRYRLLHEHSALGVGYYKPDGTIISYNELAAARMGGKPEDFNGKTIQEVFPEENTDEYMRRMNRVLNSDNNHSYIDELVLVNKKFWFKSTYANIRNEKNEIIGVQIISEDITEIKEQEKILRDSENKFRTIFENHDAIMLLVNPDTGMIEHANNSAKKFYGYTSEEFEKLSIFDLNKLTEEDVVKKMKQAQKYKTNKFHFKHLLKDKSERFVEVHSTPIQMGTKKLLFSIINDITEQKKSHLVQSVLYDIAKISIQNLSLREFLEKVHHRISTILKAENLFVALYHKDEDKYSFPYFVDETENWESKEHISLKGSLTDFVRRKRKGQLINHLNEAELRAKNEISLVGNDCPIWLGAPLFNSLSKDVIGVLAIQDYKDINAYSEKDLDVLEIIAYNIGMFIERIQKNQALEKAKNKAEESDRLKSAFLANMSHEIRTPMNGIIGFADLLKQPELSGKQKMRYIEVIEKSGERMLNIINDLIDISKIEAGQVEYTPTETNIREQAEFLCSFFKPEMVKKGLKFSCSFPRPGADDVLFTDAEKLYAVLTNLLKNALKYTPEGSVEFGYEKQQNKIRFFVKDTGIGVPEDRRTAIFDRFVQADPEDKKAMEGAGLGLAISNAYAQMMGAKIWVEANQNKGSIFLLELPDIKANAETPDFPDEKNSETAVKSTSLKDAIILIAEDEEVSDMYMTEILKNECKELLHVISGREAVDLVKSNPDISIVLMDIKMPEMSGYEATRKIREFNSEVIIIAQTAYALAGDREKALEAGCNEYLAKPVSRKKLLNTIHTLFAG